MKPDPLKAYLVEDEPLCRLDFRQTLLEFPEIRLVGEAGSLAEAEIFLKSHSIDLLFLDISIGRENGLDLVQKLPKRPLVIALTAHPEHAVRGFDLDLIDYVLKPINPTRLRAALQKARRGKMLTRFHPNAVTFIAEMDGKKTALNLEEIQGAQAMGNYVLLNSTRGTAIKRATFKEVLRKLPPLFFLETGRGRVVAISSIRSWHRDPKGRLSVELKDNSSLAVAQSHVASVLKTLHKNAIL